MGIYGGHPHNILKIGLGNKNKCFVAKCQDLTGTSKMKNYQFFTKLTLKAKISSRNTSTEQECEMCKTNVKMNIYYVSMCKHEHEKKHDKPMVQDCAYN